MKETKRTPLTVVAARVPVDVAKQLRRDAREADRRLGAHLRRVLTAATTKESTDDAGNG